MDYYIFFSIDNPPVLNTGRDCGKNSRAIVLSAVSMPTDYFIIFFLF